MYYFGYGSNMESGQMRAFCPTGERISIARLENYRLAFTRRSARWGGAAADIVTAPGHVVWGVLYYIDSACLQGLDIKEALGVAYQRMTCTVTTPDGTAYEALTYEVIAKLPQEGKPSRTYLETIITGAEEIGLPDDYIVRLRAIQHL